MPKKLQVILERSRSNLSPRDGPAKLVRRKKQLKKTTKTEQLDWTALRPPPIRQNAWPSGRPALPITKPRDTQARIAHLEEQGAARRDAVPRRVVTASTTDGLSSTRAEAQEAGAGSMRRGAEQEQEQEQRRGSEEEGGVSRGGSNGRERGGGAAAM